MGGHLLQKDINISNNFKKKVLINKIIERNKKLTLNENEKLFLSLHSLISAGIPILKSLTISKNQISSKKTIDKVIKEIEKGESFENALKKSNAFSSFTVSIISAGENSGKLTEAFENLTYYFKTMNMIKQNVQGALYYPLMVLTSIIFLILYVIFNFIPSLVDLYGGDIAYSSSWSFYVIKTSMFIKEYFMEVTLTFFSIISIIVLLFKTISKNPKFYGLKYKIPILGNILKKQSINNSIWSLYILLDSGIPIMTAFDIISDNSHEKIIKEYIFRIKEDLESGYPLSESLVNLNLKDEILLYFVYLGEETGDMVQKLKLISEIYTKDITNGYKELSQVVQPLFIGIMTLIVGALMFSVILPLLNYDVFYNL